MPATEFLRSALGNHVLTEFSYTAPSNLYLALFTVAPTVEGGGTEVSGGSYARQEITFTEDNVIWGEFTNNSVSFTDMPETTVVALGIYPTASGGDLLYFETFSPVSVDASDTYPVNAGVITVRHI